MVETSPDRTQPDWVRALVANAPPLSVGQVDRLRNVFEPKVEQDPDATGFQPRQPATVPQRLAA